MDENGRMKFNGLSQLVKLKEALLHLQAIAARQRKKAVGNGSESKNVNENESENHQMLSVVINKRLTGYLCCDSDEESCQSPEHPADVPRGFLAVYVGVGEGEGQGQELRRFIIPTSYLSHTVFKVLLEKAEEEFGFDHGGGLTLPCETETFKYLLKCMENQPMGLPAESTPGGGTSCLTMEG